MPARFGPRLTYANVMSTLAVVLAVGGGTAIAVSLPKNSVGSKQIEKNAVKAPEIRKNAVASGEIRNNRVLGADVDESTLGEVPSAARSITAISANSADSAISANSANSANSADSANSAFNADNLDGLDSSAFLSAGKATINGPVRVVDDPVGGGSTNVTLMTAGPVTLTGRCTDTGANRIAQVSASASSLGGWISAVVQDDENDADVVAFQSSITAAFLTVLSTPSATGSAVAETRTGSFSLFHPGSNVFRTGNMFAAANVDGDCAFGVAAFG